MSEHNDVGPDILGMLGDPSISQEEITRAIWAYWGYVPDDGTNEWAQAYNDSIRRARLAYERSVLGKDKLDHGTGPFPTPDGTSSDPTGVNEP